MVFNRSHNDALSHSKIARKVALESDFLWSDLNEEVRRKWEESTAKAKPLLATSSAITGRLCSIRRSINKILVPRWAL